MGFLSNLFGKSVETLENEGDLLAARESWGEAKVKFESAMEKLEAENSFKNNHRSVLEKKLKAVDEALAASHLANAADLIDAGCWEDARELLTLAGQLDERSATAESVARLTKKAEEQEAKAPDGDEYELDYYSPEAEEEEAPDEYYEDDDELFEALCNTLPEPLQPAYVGYGASFKEGYLALNRGDFEFAAQALRRAREENPEPGTHIDFELANACLNLGERDEAESLLSAYITNHPDALPAYGMLCEIYWDKSAFADADSLLKRIPPDFSDTLAAFLLRGEHLVRTKRLETAKTFYSDCISNYGGNQFLARELAKVCEMRGEKEQALNIYTEVINDCAGCGSHVDPFLKRKYADLSFELGDASSRILETYLALAREDIANAADYYLRVSAIYKHQGNHAESKRFAVIAAKAAGAE